MSSYGVTSTLPTETTTIPPSTDYQITTETSTEERTTYLPASSITETTIEHSTATETTTQQLTTTQDASTIPTTIVGTQTDTFITTQDGSTITFTEPALTISETIGKTDIMLVIQWQDRLTESSKHLDSNGNAAYHDNLYTAGVYDIHNYSEYLDGYGDAAYHDNLHPAGVDDIYDHCEHRDSHVDSTHYHYFHAAGVHDIDDYCEHFDSHVDSTYYYYFHTTRVDDIYNNCNINATYDRYIHAASLDDIYNSCEHINSNVNATYDHYIHATYDHYIHAASVDAVYDNRHNIDGYIDATDHRHFYTASFDGVDYDRAANWWPCNPPFATLKLSQPVTLCGNRRYSITVWVKMIGPTLGVSYPLNYAVSVCNSSGVCDVARVSGSASNTFTPFTVEVSTRTAGDAKSFTAAFTPADSAPTTEYWSSYFDDFSITDLGPVCLWRRI
ncbi:hypothetical protein LTS10_008162 [Elasticomyces elasticus]|nr:hypothetical protein LTS10_008162 [Elasticomyces elasticus]